MFIRKNHVAAEAVQRASFRDTPVDEMKSLYLALNTFDVALDQAIYRVVAEALLIDDINRRCLTHTRIDKVTWLDNSENPLKDVMFTDPHTGEQILVNGIVENMFGVCWTMEPSDSQLAWDNFSHGHPSVRIKSTPRKLLSAVMNLADPFYMLHHHIGKVSYEDSDRIREHFVGKDYTKHLDSLGQGIVLSLLQLRTAVSVENEVRLIYSYMPGEEWVQENVKAAGDYCKVPFVWDNVIDEVMVGPLIAAGGAAKLITELEALNIRCPVVTSSFRSYRG